MNHARFLTILGFIFFAMMSRFWPHPPNFTAINAIALFSACTFGNLGLSFLVVFLSMFISDLFFGFHSQMIFVYCSLASTLFLSKFRLSIPITLILSSLSFFIVVNFGVWLFDGLYPSDLKGLGLCYFAALPFLANQVFGDLLYGFALFGLFSSSEKIFPSIASSSSV